MNETFYQRRKFGFDNKFRKSFINTEIFVGNCKNWLKLYQGYQGFTKIYIFACFYPKLLS